MIAKKGLETGEDCDTVPDSMRQYLAMHLDPTKAHARNVLNRSNGYPIGGPNAPGKISMYLLCIFFLGDTLLIEVLLSE